MLGAENTYLDFSLLTILAPKSGLLVKSTSFDRPNMVYTLRGLRRHPISKVCHGLQRRARDTMTAINVQIETIRIVRWSCALPLIC